MATVQQAQTPILFDFQELLPELKSTFIKFAAGRVISEVVNKAVFSNADIEGAGRELIQLSRVCVEFRRCCSKQLDDIRKIFTLYNKYSIHNRIYLKPGCYFDPDSRMGKMVPCGNPQLLDLLSTGYPNTALPVRSFERFTEEQYQDMEQIVRLMPRSLMCNIGQLRVRDFVTPFIMACENPEVPIKAIEFLLKNGADVNSIFCLNELKIHVLTDLRKYDEARYNQLKPILEKYGALEEVFTAFDNYVYGNLQVFYNQSNSPH